MMKRLLLLLTPMCLLAAPNNPSNLQLEALFGGLSIYITWQDNSNDETGFKIFRDDKLITIVNEDSTSFTDIGLVQNSTYKYTVKATDDEPMPLPKTGQTTSYTNNDDGDYQKGATRSYSRDDAKEIVTDNVTGLMWQDDEAAQSADSNGDDGGWQGAVDYCEALELGTFTDWRLPTIKELFYIVDKGAVDSAIDAEFKYVINRQYWSSTIYDYWPSNRWYITFDHGDISPGQNGMERYIRCVRLTSTESNLVRDNTLEVVHDTTTGLVWQDDFSHKSVDFTWQEAINHCEDMTFAGDSNWRLPNINELYSIIDISESEPAISDTFIHVNNAYYWSSTTAKETDTSAWFGDFHSASNGYMAKSGKKHVRCVKDR